MLRKIGKVIKDPGKAIEYLNSQGYFSWIPDEVYLKWQFKRRMGYDLDLINPETFNEKLQWIKLFNRNLLYTKLVDKYEVRKYVTEKIGGEYLIPLLGVWDRPEDIDWDSLPNEFVLKCTHDSGGVIICEDKKEFNIPKAIKKLNKLLKRRYYYKGREWPYKNIKERIIAEKYLKDASNNSLNDYKFYCFNGKVKTFFIASNRDTDVKYDFYDMEFNHLPIGLRNSEVELEKPAQFDEMVRIAEKLSQGIPHVRIDLYNIKQKIYFGEFTFFSDSGYEMFTPNHEKYSKLFGEWITLPNQK